MGIHEIVLPEKKPALEWVNGRALQKASSKRKHALAQGRFVAAFDAWARQHGNGIAGTEWEMRIAPPGEICRPLVPDVTFVSYDRVPFEVLGNVDILRVAPDAVVEVRSEGDGQRDVEEKIRVYLACGVDVVFLVDTKHQTVTLIDGARPCVFHRDDVVRHASLKGFALPAHTLFDPPQPRSRPASETQAR